MALWQAANREAVNEIKRRYKARKRAAVTVTFTADQLAQKVTHWGHCCWICRGPYQAVDHVKPLAKGGPHMLANLRPICTRCNSSKNDRWPFLAA